MNKTQQLKAMAERQPFRAFSINLKGGEQITITHPEALYFPPIASDLLIAFTEDQRMHLFEHTVISSINQPES